MEPNQINQNQPPEEPAVEKPEASAPPEVPAKKTPTQMLTALGESVRAKIKPPTSSTPKIPKKAIIVAAALILLLIIAVIVVRLVSSGITNNILPADTPTPTPTATPVSQEPSQYAEDPEVLSIIEDVRSLDRDLNETTFREDTLRIPSLDWNVTF